MWTGRILIESWAHEFSSFWTLTYKDAPYSLEPSHLKSFHEKIKKRILPRRQRYFSVGEYGDKSGRAHFHCILFGVGAHERSLVEKCWTDEEGRSRGFVYSSELDKNRAAYCAGYVIKKLTHPKDDRLSEGQLPEFCRMSLRPGIGAKAVPLLANAIDGPGIVEACEDVPRGIRIGGKLYPLGKYLRSKLRDEIGFTEEYKQSLVEKFKNEKSDELSPLFKSAFNVEEGLSWPERSRFLADTKKLQAKKLEQKIGQKQKGKVL
jgi:hypothetical protein